jgi:hypothetical protein
MKRTSFSLLCLSLLIALLASACNLPRGQEEGTVTPDVTQAFQTVQARLTEAALQTPVPSPSPAPTDPVTVYASPTSAAPTLTSSPPPTTSVPTKAVQLCDQAEAGSPIDVTIPDGTTVAPGQSFTKVWRLRNSGTCTWSRDYSIAVFSGEPMNAPNKVSLPKQIEPGQTVDISVDLVAPTSKGTYRGNWKLRNASGAWFGIGSGAGLPFWVEIVVSGGTLTPSSATPTATEENGATQSPTEIPAENPAVQISGSKLLNVGDGLDLDNNQTNSGGEDVGLIPNAQGKVLLTTVGNAGMIGVGGNPPSYVQCKSAGLGPGSTNAKNLPSGLYLCYRTDQGRYGWMQIVSYNENAGTLSVKINTWVNP